MRTTWKVRSIDSAGEKTCLREKWVVNLKINNCRHCGKSAEELPTSTIKKILGIKGSELDIEVDGYEVLYLVYQKGEPIGEVICTSHSSLFPIILV